MRALFGGPDRPMRLRNELEQRVDAVPPGGEIPNTQGSVDLLTLFASMARGQNGGGSQTPAPAQGTSP